MAEVQASLTRALTVIKRSLLRITVGKHLSNSIHWSTSGLKLVQTNIVSRIKYSDFALVCSLFELGIYLKHRYLFKRKANNSEEQLNIPETLVSLQHGFHSVLVCLQTRAVCCMHCIAAVFPRENIPVVNNARRETSWFYSHCCQWPFSSISFINNQIMAI